MRKVALFIIIYMSLFQNSYSEDEFLKILKYEKNKNIEKKVCSLSRKALKIYLKEGRIIRLSSDIFYLLREPRGVFVTTIKNGKVRSCMGTIQPHEMDISREIIRSTIMSATLDPWNSPIKICEIDKIKFIISIVGRIRRVYSKNQLNPKKYGLLIRKGRRSALLLPGEALTSQWQIFKCKKKAGISQNEPVEMFIFETVTFGPY